MPSLALFLEFFVSTERDWFRQLTVDTFAYGELSTINNRLSTSTG